MEGVEREFDRSWEAVVGQRDAQLQQDQQALRSALQEELDTLLASVQQSMAEDQPELEQKIAELSGMARQFHDAVGQWQAKAKEGVRVIEEQQRAFGAQVQEAAIRTSARREDLLQRQQQRTEDAREKCAVILHDARAPSAV